MSFLLPPFGYALILVRSTLRERTNLADVMRALAPFLLAQIAVLLLVVTMPALVHVFDPPKPAPVPAFSKQEIESRSRPITMPPPPVFGLPALPPFAPKP